MKKMVKSLACLLIAEVVIITTGTTRVNASPSKINQMAPSQNNPYVTEYLAEHNQNGTHSYSKADTADDAISKNVLTYYYTEDLKVANILTKACNSDFTVLAISLQKQDKINVMHRIKDIYSTVPSSTEKSTLLAYMGRYATDSCDSDSIDFYKNTVSNMQRLMSININYDGDSAADWAYNNYNQYSSDYPAFINFQSDCQNFVSQAMHVGGGMAMQGTWYCYKKNDTYLAPNSMDQLNYSWSLADPSPWISVAQFNSYWGSRVATEDYSHDSYKLNHNSIYSHSIRKGDVIQLEEGIANWITYPTHAMIISQYDVANSDFKLAAHSHERQAYPLLQAINDYVGVKFFLF